MALAAPEHSEPLHPATKQSGMSGLRSRNQRDAVPAAEGWANIRRRRCAAENV